MNKNEGLKRLNSLGKYDRGVRLKYSSFHISHFLFLISHFSYRAKTFDKYFKGSKMYIINIAKVLFHANQQL